MDYLLPEQSLIGNNISVSAKVDLPIFNGVAQAGEEVWWESKLSCSLMRFEIWSVHSMDEGVRHIRFPSDFQPLSLHGYSHLELIC